MQTKSIHYVIANFGGPRDLEEIAPFLQALLTDQDVVRTQLPAFFHRWLFSRIARKRAVKIAPDYLSIGGKSPIYADTEAVATELRKRIDAEVTTFHRYLPGTHPAFIQTLAESTSDEIRVFPMFPQFTYATTGSIARWFDRSFSKRVVNKMRWIKSYPTHPGFVQAHQEIIRKHFDEQSLKHEETILLFSAHGVPKKFIQCGDLYQDECKASYEAIMKAFPQVLGHLSFQSKFGPGEWLRPYTSDVSEGINDWNQGRQNIVFVPISFTSDHIETLFEVEEEYMTVIRKKGFAPYRVPALTLHPTWIDAIEDLLQTDNVCNNAMLIRPPCPRRCTC